MIFGVILLLLFVGRSPNIRTEVQCHETRNRKMKATLYAWVFRLRYDRLGQDLVEYALMAGFVAVAGGAVFPTTLMPGVSTIFSRINTFTAAAASQGS